MSLLGDAFGFVGGILGVEGSKDVNSAQLAAMGGNQEFLQYNSDTAYQRAVRDMKHAGLNPMLAYSQGGASTPGAPAVPKLENVGAAGVAGAAQGAQIGNIIEQNKKLQAETKNIEADTENKRETLPRIKADAQVSEETITLVQNQARKVAEEGLNVQVARQKLEYEVRGQEYIAIREKYNTLLTMLDYKQMAPERVRQLKATAELLELDIPKAMNEAAAESTSWKKYVSPFLGDVGKVTSSAARGAFLGRGLRP